MKQNIFHLWSNWKAWLKKEAVLSVSTLFALLSMIIEAPSRNYIKYIDFRVLSLLFCLMAVVAGFQECGLFVIAARKLLSGRNNLRRLSWFLIMLPFFSSMFITNDVALITFVPFTILIFKIMDQNKYLAKIVVLQTIAANLGSMTTPVGNPQNLYLYGKFNIPAVQFFSVMLPLTCLSFLFLTLAVLLLPKKSMEVQFGKAEGSNAPKGKSVLYSLLFFLCLLSVFRILSYELTLAVVLIALVFLDRRILLQADYILLLTFIAFFIFAGNMGEAKQVKLFLEKILSVNPTLFSALTSQFISNVPAAVLLSGFTQDWKALLIGTNLGGLGTPIASLASLISLKFFIKEMPHRTWNYLKIFFLLNLAFFIILYISSKSIH